jgi:putative serine protease PepD
VNENQNESPSSDYNRQFLFDVVETPMAKPKKPSLASRVSGKTSSLSLAAMITLGSVLGAGVGAGVGITAYSLLIQPSPIVVNDASSVGWVTGAASVASPSVVTISVSGSNGAGSGSGVILTESGYILTNTHVVTLDGSTAVPTIEVKTADGHVFAATVIGTDPTNDLAVIKVESLGKLKPASFADSSQLNVGAPVVAIGAPLGLEATVTAGIISALNRTIQVDSSAAPENSGPGQGGLQLWNGNGKAPINLSVIQTDAAINPGNSGGALVDQLGQIIGVNVAIASAGSSSGGQTGNIGVGFAIPANVAKRIATEIMKNGKASHALLGALVSDATNSNTAASFSTGAKVEELSAGGPAAKAGIQVGDIIISLDGRSIASKEELTGAVREHPANAIVLVKVIRDGQELTIRVTLGDAVNLK